MGFVNNLFSELKIMVYYGILIRMECKRCKNEMVKRASKAPVQSVQVYVCPKCGTVVIIDADGDQNWEP